MAYGIIEHELAKPSVFKDESRLLPDYVPLNLVHREQQLRSLARIFRVLVESPGTSSPKAILLGPVGVGKTAVSKRFGSTLSELAKRRGITLRYVHVNCHKDRSLFLVVKRIAQSFIPNIPERGYSAQELFDFVLRYLEDRSEYLLLTLDEVDFLINVSGEDPLYFFTRVADESLNAVHRLSLMVISRDLNFLSKLSESTRSSLLHNLIKFEKYTAQQLFNILSERAREALRSGAIDDDTLMLIADIAGRRGDARYALELLWRAGKYADAEFSAVIHPEHVRKALSEVVPGVPREVLTSLPLHEQLTLLAVARILKRSKAAYSTMGEVEREYRAICEQAGEEPRKHTKFWEYIQNLKNAGILIARLSGQGIRGKTTLIGLGEISIEAIERVLVKEEKILG
ncbi:MAG: ORC1-type DNA replication protein [Candidatus Verstraetearchaeota archaeon]|nr:ORC1-type DNA replication protein [Candidatus Verstraetearchaeota archaeon]